MNIFLVGGAVRDKLLNYPCTEKDWVVVGATPQQMLALGYQQVGKDFPVFLHPTSKEEYALARTERKSASGHTGFACHSSPDVTLEQDLKRRDLTINAMAESEQGELIDPYRGRQDLADKQLRHVSDAFVEDPLRVLRVARFYARYKHLGFTIAEETLNLMQHIAGSGELLALPAERIWKELEKALGEHNPEAFFTALEHSHALTILLPELSPPDAQALQRLQTAATGKLSKPIRFALLFADLSSDNAHALLQRLKAPNEYAELATMVNRFANSSCQSADAGQQLQLLEQLDAFRRTERFGQFIQCCELLSDDPRNIRQLQQALAVAGSIDPRSFVEQGLTGKAIAEALHQARIEALSKP